MSGYWEFRTPHGAFRVVPSAGRYTAAFEEESLGSYFTAEQALMILLAARQSGHPWGTRESSASRMI